MKIQVLVLSCFFGFIFLLPLQGEVIQKKYEKNYQKVFGKVLLTWNHKKITVSENLKFTINMLVPKGFQGQLPKFQEYGFAKNFRERSNRFRVTDISAIQKKKEKDGSIRYTQTFTLDPFLSGNYSFPPLMIGFYQNNSKKSNSSWKRPDFYILTEGLRIRVEPLSKTNKKLSPIFSPSDLDQKEWTKKIRRKEDKSTSELKREKKSEEESQKALLAKHFPWKILGFFVGFLLLVIAWYFGQKKWTKFFEKPAPLAHVIAYKALEKLKQKNWLEEGKLKEYYYELSYILRGYIEDRFFIFALHQTSEEFFIALLKKNPFDKGQNLLLQNFMDHTDEVKYALHLPSKEKAFESFEIVKEFVDKTKQEEEKEEK